MWKKCGPKNGSDLESKKNVKKHVKEMWSPKWIWFRIQKKCEKNVIEMWSPKWIWFRIQKKCEKNVVPKMDLIRLFQDWTNSDSD